MVEAPVVEPYESGTWQGLKRYACPHCSFSVVRDRGPERIQEHVDLHHPTKWLEE